MVLEVVWFNRVRLVCLGAPWVSLWAFGFVWFVTVHPWGRLVRWVRLGLSISSGCAFNLVWFVRVRPEGRWVLSGKTGSSVYVLLGSFGLLRVRPGCRLVRSSSSASFGSTLLGSVGFVWFVRVCPGGRLVQVRLVRPRTPWRSLGSFSFDGFVCFVHMRPKGHWIRSGTCASFGSAIGVLGSFVFVWFVWVRPACRSHSCISGRWVLYGSSASFGSALRVLGSSELFGCAQGAAGFVLFAWMRPNGR